MLTTAAVEHGCDNQGQKSPDLIQTCNWTGCQDSRVGLYGKTRRCRRHRPVICNQSGIYKQAHRCHRYDYYLVSPTAATAIIFRSNGTHNVTLLYVCLRPTLATLGVKDCRLNRARRTSDIFGQSVDALLGWPFCT